MLAYLILIEIALVALTIHESYKYFIFKYRSNSVSATVKEVHESKLFQRPSTKMIEGEKRVQKITFEYEVNDKKYKKTAKIAKDIMTIKVGENIQVRIVDNNSELYTFKSDAIYFRRVVFALIALLGWSILTYVANPR